MDIFSHINEVGKGAWQSLRTLVLVCPKVVVWAPSALYLQSLGTEDDMLVTPDELFWYVQNNHVQIVGRDWWIQDRKERDKSRWEFAKWMDGFDDRVFDLCRDDQRKGLTGSSAHVRIALPETGIKWAEDQISSGFDYGAFFDAVQANDLLEGYQRKMAGLAPREAVKSLLRDVHNHAVAFAQSGSNRNLGAPHDSVLLRIFAETSGVSQDLPLP